MPRSLDEQDDLARWRREAEVGVQARADVVTVEAPAARQEAQGDAQDNVHIRQPRIGTRTLVDLRTPVEG